MATKSISRKLADDNGLGYYIAFSADGEHIESGDNLEDVKSCAVDYVDDGSDNEPVGVYELKFIVNKKVDVIPFSTK